MLPEVDGATVSTIASPAFKVIVPVPVCTKPFKVSVSPAPAVPLAPALKRISPLFVDCTPPEPMVSGLCDWIVIFLPADIAPTVVS